jgi:hypothetical protein
MEPLRQKSNIQVQLSGNNDKFLYRPIAHDVTAPVTMHLEDKLAIYE